MRVGLQRELDYKESWAPKNWCFWIVVLEKTLESPLDCKEIQSLHPKGNQNKYSLEGMMLKLKLQSFGHLMRRADSWKRPWCWERWRAGGEGDDRGWDGWMASLTQWTWVWGDSGKWWRTEKPGMLQSMRLQRVGHDLATQQQQQQIICLKWKHVHWFSGSSKFPDINSAHLCVHFLCKTPRTFSIGQAIPLSQL